MPVLSDEMIQSELSSMPGWELVQGPPKRIRKTFATGAFMAGLAFVTKAAELAEKAGHHPDVTLTYPKVIIELTTHDVGGISAKDLSLASELDELA